MRQIICNPWRKIHVIPDLFATTGDLSGIFAHQMLTQPVYIGDLNRPSVSGDILQLEGNNEYVAKSFAVGIKLRDGRDSVVKLAIIHQHHVEGIA